MTVEKKDLVAEKTSFEADGLVETRISLERRYKYVFTMDEIMEHKDVMVQNMSEKESLENEKKQVMSDYKEKIEAKTLEIGNLHSKLSRGYEFKMKKVKVYLDFERKCRVLVDDDGLLFGEEGLEDSDYQLKLALEEEATKNEAETDAGTTVEDNGPVYREM